MKSSTFLLIFGLVSFSCADRPEGLPAAADSTMEGYWALPIRPQGAAPAHWTAIERSLSPDACAMCHPQQHEQWKTSLHSKAFSPGFVGQLLDFDTEEAAACMECHAALAEQRKDFETARAYGEGHLSSGQGLAAFGNSCAGCHVRDHRRFGPPQSDTGTTGQSAGAAPHGGVYRSAFFERAEFCSGCHQFPQSYAINGKPLENTYVEWQSSPYAAQGKTCQKCHMPNRKHHWRGIHDPTMVESGLTAEFGSDENTVWFKLTSTGVGHAFPTYVTPKVLMRAAALDEEGNPRSDADTSLTIQRVVKYVDGRWVESSDSRLMPDESVTLVVPWQGSVHMRMWLEIHPDDYYDHHVYDVLLDQLSEGTARELIARADSTARASRFRLFETDLQRP